jgi:FKBP-type peptidyl-prolyl cis-trans isomerase
MTAMALEEEAMPRPVDAKFEDFELKSVREKGFFLFGLQQGWWLKNNDAALEAFNKGVKAGLEGKLLHFPDKEVQETMLAFRQELQAAAEAKQKGFVEKIKKEGEEFLAKNKTAEGVKTTESGLQYKVLMEGEGEPPRLNDDVVVHYVGRLLNGVQFDSSLDRKQPMRIRVTTGQGGVIKGWVEALQLMNPKAKFKVWLPASLAYGDQGSSPSIPPGATLEFEIELLEVHKAAPGMPRLGT